MMETAWVPKNFLEKIHMPSNLWTSNGSLEWKTSVLLKLKPTRTLWGSWAWNLFYVLPFPFVGNRLQPPWPSLSSKGLVPVLLIREGRGCRDKGGAAKNQYWSPGAGLSVQFHSVAQLCPTLCDPMDHSRPGLPVHHQHPSLLKLMSIKSVVPSNHLILCHPLLLPSIFLSIRVFPNESVLRIRCCNTSHPKYCSFNISPSNEYSVLISFRIDSFDLLAVHGILKSLLQHHSSKVSILRCSAVFMVQLSHLYMTTGKTTPSCGCAWWWKRTFKCTLQYLWALLQN